MLPGRIVAVIIESPCSAVRPSKIHESRDAKREPHNKFPRCAWLILHPLLFYSLPAAVKASRGARLCIRTGRLRRGRACAA